MNPFSEVVDAVFLFIHNNYGDFSAILKDQGINYSQYAALVTIHMYESLTEGELAKVLFLNPSSVSRMVFNLEKKGWLKAVRDLVDRRKVIVTLTPAGKRRMQAMKNMQADVLARQIKGLESEKRDYVYKVADLLNQALRYLSSTETIKS